MKKDVYDLSKPQESIWLTEQYFKNTNINRIICFADFSPKTDTVDFDILKKALNTMIKHNDVFQTRLFLDNGTIKQYFCDFKEFDFPIYEISSFDDFIKNELEVLSFDDLMSVPESAFKEWAERQRSAEFAEQRSEGSVSKIDTICANAMARAAEINAANSCQFRQQDRDHEIETQGE